MKNNKLVLGGSLIGVILIGLITNAIWDGLKPLTAYLFKLILNLSVLGVEKFKDNIYFEIAKGMHEGTSLQVFLTMYAFIVSFIFVTILTMLLIRKKMSIMEGGERNQSFFDRFYTYQKDLPRKSWFLWFCLLYTLFFGTIFLLDSVKQKYINSAVTNFEQLSKIVRPYLSQEDSIKYISAFSQIKNKRDYENIIYKLQSLAKDNNQRVPEFDLTF